MNICVSSESIPIPIPDGAPDVPTCSLSINDWLDRIQQVSFDALWLSNGYFHADADTRRSLPPLFNPLDGTCQEDRSMCLMRHVYATNSDIEPMWERSGDD